MSVEVTTTGGTIVSASTGSGTSVSLTSSSTSISVASPNKAASVSLIDNSASITVASPSVNSVSLTSKGPTGDTGATGPQGEIGSDKFYKHIQRVASSLWIVTHNLNKYPSVSVTDSAGTVVIGMVDYDSLNQVTLNFKSTFSGTVYFN